MDDSLIIEVAKMAVVKREFSTDSIKAGLSLGERRATILLEELQDLKVITSEGENSWKCLIKDTFLLGKYLPSSLDSIKSFLNSKTEDVDTQAIDFDLDIAFDYNIETIEFGSLTGSILSYYILKETYWQKYTPLNVLLRLIKDGSEVNPILTIGEDVYQLIDALLQILEGSLFEASKETRAAAFNNVQQYFNAIKAENKWKDELNKYEERLNRFAKK